MYQKRQDGRVDNSDAGPREIELNIYLIFFLLLDIK